MEVRRYSYLFNYYSIVTNWLFIFIELYTLLLKYYGEKRQKLQKQVWQ
jgi:uncharacterized membrane protein (DUF373 family)